MKKRIFLSLIMILCLGLVLVGCKHKHDYSAEWAKDETNHWHVCSGCEEKAEEAAHTYDEGVVTKEAMPGEKGVKTYTCSVCGYQKTEDIEALKNVAGVIASKNNDSVEFIGVIFGLVKDGFYVSDGTAGAYVKLTAANQSQLSSLKVGDEVRVTGKLSVSTSQVFVKNASAKVLANGKNAINAEVATIGSINALSASDAANFGKFFNVTAAVSYDAANQMVWTDATGSIIIDNAVAANFASYAGKKVNANIVLASYNAQWNAYAFVEGASEYFVDVNTVKEEIFGGITLDENVYGYMSLVTSYEAEPGIVFTWTVKDGTALTVENGKAIADLTITEDAAVTLTLTLTSGTTSASQDFTTTVKAVSELSIAAAKNTNDEYILVSGLVVGKGIADETGTIHYIILMDEETQELILVDCSSKMRENVAVGSTLQVLAKYRTEERPALYASRVYDVIGEAKEIDYSTLNSTKLETAADYQDAANNHHDDIVLYAIYNPYMVGSGSGSYNWERFGADKDSAGAGTFSNRKFSFLISNFAANGLNDWLTTYNVPISTEGAKQYPGTIIYAYSIYQTGETVWAFVIPSNAACVYSLEEAIKVEVLKAVPEKEIIANQAGTFELPASVTINEVVYELTWASSDEEVLNSTTGAYVQVFEDMVLTLTASFVIEEVSHELEIAINVLQGEVEPISVSEAITAGTGTVAKLHAYVAAIAGTSNNVEEYRNGIMLTDGKQVIYWPTTEYEIGEVAIAVGDLLEFKGATLTADENGNTLSASRVSIVSSGNAIDYSELVYTTVSSEEELAAFIAGHGLTHGLVVKFEGTMNFVGTGSTAKNPRYQVNYKEATSSATARYTFIDEASRSLTISLPSSYDLLGFNWWEDCGMPEKSGSKCFTVSGSFYAVGGYNGDTMQAWTIINAAGFDLPYAHNVINDYLTSLFPTDSITAEEAGTITLPASYTVRGVEYALTWETSDSNVVTAAGAYAAQTTDTTATLTANYTIGTEAKSWSIELTFKAKEVQPLTVSEAITAGSGTVEKLEAIIASKSYNSAASGANSDGFMLTDGVKFIYYPTTVTAVGEHTLVAGDKIIIAGGSLTVSADAHKLTGGAIEVVSSGNTINYTNLSVDVTITSDADLVAFLGAHNPVQGLVVKFTGDFSIVGTGSTSANPRYQLNYKDATKSANARYAYVDYTDADHGNRTLAFQTQGGKDVLGTDWWLDFDATAEATGSKCFKGTGTIYAVAGQYGATMQGWTIINPAAYSVTSR